MAHIYRLISILAVFIIAIVYGDDMADECRPTPPQKGKEKEICCKIPHIIKKSGSDDIHKSVLSCILSLKDSHPDILPEGFRGQPGTHKPRGPPPLKLMECIQECIYNNSGLLTADMKPKGDAIKKMANALIGDEESWKSVADDAVKKCSESAPSVKDDAVCKSGAHQTTVCMMREIYLHCPEASWTDSDECKAEKDLILKCPEMPPPFHHKTF